MVGRRGAKGKHRGQRGGWMEKGVDWVVMSLCVSGTVCAHRAGVCLCVCVCACACGSLSHVGVYVPVCVCTSPEAVNHY